MKIVGLTGGIATGKSTVTEMLRKHGFKIVDADQISRSILVEDDVALKAVRNTFGDVVFEGEALDRKALGQIVFSDKQALEKLEAIVHPRVRHIILGWIDHYEKLGEQLVIIDAPLLIEGGLKELCDYICIVVANECTQIERIIQRDHVSEEYAKKIIANQMTSNEKNQYADYTIDNSKSIEALENRVDELISVLTELDEI